VQHSIFDVSLGLNPLDKPVSHKATSFPEIRSSQTALHAFVTKIFEAVVQENVYKTPFMHISVLLA
jgi:hypothetical protein